MGMNKGLYSSDSIYWETPRHFYDRLNAEFSFTLDVCATPDNAKCEQFYTERENGLAQQWEGICWMNPPYGNEISKWMRKAWISARNGTTVVCLVPARTDTTWWHSYVMEAHEIRFVRRRLKFGGDAPAPFPSAVIVFRGNASRRFGDYPTVFSVEAYELRPDQYALPL